MRNVPCVFSVEIAILALVVVVCSQETLSDWDALYLLCAQSPKQMAKLGKVGQESKSRIKVFLCDPTTFLQITTLFRGYIWATKNSPALLRSPNPLHGVSRSWIQLILLPWPQCFTSPTLAIKSSPGKDDSVVQARINEHACGMCAWCEGANREWGRGGNTRIWVGNTFGSLTLITNPLPHPLPLSDNKMI